MSKNLSISLIALIVTLGVVGALLLFIFKPDATATFISFIGTTSAFLLAAVVTVYGLGQVNKKVEEVAQATAQVQRQTNGINSRLQDANEQLTSIIVEEAIAPRPVTRPIGINKEGA